MTNRDSTQQAPPMSPHYRCLSHPLVHDPHSYNYLDCLDILENAKNLLDLFQHLDLSKSGEHGGLSPEATTALFCLAKMLEDTLSYVGLNLENAWWKRDANKDGKRIQERMQNSVLIKALQGSKKDGKSPIYSQIASCLNITSADVEAFFTILEEWQDRSTEDKNNEQVLHPD